MIHLEIIERVPRQSQADLHTPDVSDMDTYEPLGILNLGDVATLRDEDGDEITIVVGRVRIDPQLPQRGGTPLTSVPAEVVPFLEQARGRGIICYRELALRDGDHVRLKAVVEPTRSVASSGYRSGTTVSYVARDDLAPVVLEEVLGSPF